MSTLRPTWRRQAGSSSSTLELNSPLNPALSSLFPNPDDLLTLEVEELAGVVLTLLNSQRPAHISQGPLNFNLGDLVSSDYRCQPEYGPRQKEVSRALGEAWAWLQSENFLIVNPDQAVGTFYLSRRAQRLNT